MKKVFLMLAFAGLVGSVSAAVKSTGDDDKAKAKKECKKDSKCCKDKAADGKTTDGKACAAGEKKACCKDKKATETKGATETK